MQGDLVSWAVIERTFIQEEIRWLEAGGRVLSPSGNDITKEQLNRLKGRLEHVNLVLSEK